MKINKHIEIVRATKNGLSSMDKSSCATVQQALMQRYEHVGVTIVNDAADLEAVTAMRPDLVFIGVKRLPHTVGSSTTKVWVNDYLDGQDINYTGSPASAIALDLNKPIAKRVVAAANLPTAEFFTASVGQYSSAKALPLDFPLFVKPPDEGGGKGISSHSVVRDFADFQRQLLAITARFQTDALVERYLTGREFSVAILDAVDSNAPMAMPVELVTERNAQGDRILGKDVKNADTEQVLAVEDEGIRRAVSGLALDVFKALGGRDYGRIDIRMDERGVPHFLEANLLPGLSGYDSEGGYFTRACQMNMAMDYQTMILRIVELALARGSHSDLNVTIPIITMLPTLDAVF